MLALRGTFLTTGADTPLPGVVVVVDGRVALSAAAGEIRPNEDEPLRAAPLPLLAMTILLVLLPVLLAL